MRRYAPMKASRGTVIPPSMRIRVLTRDDRSNGGCVGFGRIDIPCEGGLELDHVRASHGIGMKSLTCDCNLIALCGSHHRHKTLHGKTDRPLYLAYLATFSYSEHEEGHAA